MPKLKESLTQDIKWWKDEAKRLFEKDEATIKFLNSQKVSNLTELGNKIAGLENSLAGEQNKNTQLGNDNLDLKKQINTALNEWNAIDLKDLSKIARNKIDSLDKELKIEKTEKENQKVSYTSQLNQEKANLQQANKELTEEKEEVGRLTKKEIELSDELSKRGKRIERLESKIKILEKNAFQNQIEIKK